MIYHHIAACSKVGGLDEIFIVGDFEVEVFSQFMEAMKKEFSIKITCVTVVTSRAFAPFLSFR